MECKFIIGQKIVYLGCIHKLDGYNGSNNLTTNPVRCGIYTVRELTLCPKNNIPLVRVKEIRNALRQYIEPWGLWEMAWHHLNFRPLEELKTTKETTTNITLFKKILDEVKKEEEKV